MVRKLGLVLTACLSIIGFLLFSPPVFAQQQPSSQWHAILLVYSSADVDYEDNGVPQHFSVTLPQDQVDAAVWSFTQFPMIAQDFSGGEISVSYDIIYVPHPLTKITSMGSWYWVSPSNIKPDLDQYAQPGSYDSVFVFWPQNDPVTNQAIPSGGAWGWGTGPAASGLGATYATVANGPRWMWAIPTVGEVWLHEWLHGVCSYYAGRGFAMPQGDADAGGSHGYIHSSQTGWAGFYRDLMTGHVLENGVNKGISPQAWRSGSILEHKVRSTLEISCDVQKYNAEDVACLVDIDGISKDSIAAGQKNVYVLDKGSHTATVSLSGSQAGLWSPGKLSKSAVLSAGSTTRLKFSFAKSGHLTIVLDKPGVVGDFFVDGIQVATQRDTAVAWVEPNKSHKIEVTNLADPIYATGVWQMSYPGFAYLSPGSEQTTTLRLKGAPVNISPLLGTWLGTANTASGAQFDISFTFNSYPPCTFGAICGSFKIVTWGCSGKVRMLSLTGSIYSWEGVGKQGCGETTIAGKDTLTLNPDGTIHYRYDSADGGWSDGILTKK